MCGVVLRTPHDGGEVGSPLNTLEFHDVTRRFGEATILSGLSASIPLEGMTFVVGASGSGKSVLCRLAVGLLRPDAGEVRLLGERVDTLPERKLQALRARAPYLVQGPALLDWLSLEDNVALADRASKRDGRAEEALARVGLAAWKTRLPPEVGPGIRKRAAIARALVLAPQVLLLDEPTTGLDLEAAQQVNETLDAVRHAGVAVMLVSHDYAALRRYADRVVRVARGQVDFNGPARDFPT